MATFTTSQWAILALIACAGVFAMLHAVAAQVRNCEHIRDHMAECRRLRANYLQLQSQRHQHKQDDQGDVEIVG